MNFVADHPLMKIKSLDAPVGNSSGRKKKIARKRRWSQPLIPRAPVRTLKMVTRSQAMLLQSETTELKLSESESSDSEEVNPRQSPASNDYDDDSTEEDVPNKLLDDLKLSSDDESQQSDTSEITAPSVSDDEESSTCKAAEPLTDRLPGKGYFWVQKAPGHSVVDDFRNISIAKTDDVVILFKRLCRDLPIERASLMLTDKLRPLPSKRCIELLKVFYEKFQLQISGTGMANSMDIFGRIVMTLVLHFYRKNLFEIARQLLKFLTSKHFDILVTPPIKKEEVTPVVPSVREDADLVFMCCTIYLELREIESATKCLRRGLTEFLKKSHIVALEVLKPLMPRIFHMMIESRSNGPLLELFQHIYRTQGDTTFPIDLSIFYDGVMSSLLTSHIPKERTQAIELFEDITRFSLLSLSEIPARGLLITAAMQNVPRARIAKMLMACVNKKVYPAYDLENFSLKFYSSMTKIEMQVYLEQFLFLCEMQIAYGYLKEKPFLTFEVIVTSNTARNCKYPVHYKLLDVDHSYDAARKRLLQVLYYCLDLPSDIPVHTVLQPYQGGRFILFDLLVDQLFRNVLKVDKNNCIFCRNCT